MFFPERRSITLPILALLTRYTHEANGRKEMPRVNSESGLDLDLSVDKLKKCTTNRVLSVGLVGCYLFGGRRLQP